MLSIPKTIDYKIIDINGGGSLKMLRPVQNHVFLKTENG